MRPKESSSTISALYRTVDRAVDRGHAELRRPKSGRLNSRARASLPRAIMHTRQGTRSCDNVAGQKAAVLSTMGPGAASRPPAPSTSAPMRSTRVSRRWAFSAE
eukprot:4928014-Pyramimonas_sp.AAC.1